jgi:DNA-binding transcriptional LysR family regulator
MRFDLVDLKLFLHVAEARSITHGAERANLALASASARIRGMEDMLGVALLKRGRRGAELTEAGRSLADHARVVLQQVDVMRGELSAFARGLKGSVHILANTSALSERLPRTLAPFLAANPNISIEVEERESGQIVEGIVSGSADIGIASAAVIPDSLESYPFCRDRLVLVVPRADALAKHRQIAFADVLDRDFVGLTQGSALQTHLAGHAARLGRTIRHRVRVKGFDAICSMVEARAGIGIVPETAAKRCRRTMAIALVRLREAWSDRTLAICVRSLKSLPAPAQRLVAHLRETAG